jgi:hypothetical protein
MRKLVSIALMWIPLSVIAQAQAPDKTEESAGGSAAGAVISRISQDGQFDWSKVSPVEFLGILKTRLGPVPIFTVWNEPPPGWIKEADVELLMGLIKSREPAGHVVMSRGSYLPTKRSTVGAQAMYLINGFRRERYPTSLSSDDFRGNPSEYRKWWKKRRAI